MRYESACKASPYGCAVRRWSYLVGRQVSSPGAAVDVVTEYEDLRLPPQDGRCFRRAPKREFHGAWEVIYARPETLEGDDWEPAVREDAARWRALLPLRLTCES